MNTNFHTVLLILSFILLPGCTTIGHHDAVARKQIDFGPPETVKVCLYLDEGISEPEGRTLITNAWVVEPEMFGINIEVAEVHQWKRPAFMYQGIMDSLVKIKLEAPCDRIIALVNRHSGDLLFGLLGAEVLGAVNDDSLTHGFTIARRASLAQLAMSPTEVLEHELYHYLGCDHYHMKECYKQIAYMKQWKREHSEDFFPAWDLAQKRLLPTREAVNAHLATIVFK